MKRGAQTSVPDEGAAASPAAAIVAATSDSLPQEAHALARARAFAMHGIVQVEQERTAHGQGRHTLWTGDLGMACVLWDCISGRPGFPTLDCF